MAISTTKARRALHDAIEARRLFDRDPIDIAFRHAVVLNITLLGAVGHISEKENTGVDQTEVAKYYKKNIKYELIFKYFIESYRNSLLKTYMSDLRWASITELDQYHRMEYLIGQGVYAGQDLRDLIYQATEFWQYHLDQIDRL